MARRGGRNGRGGARGGRGGARGARIGSRSAHDTQARSSDNEEPKAKIPKTEAVDEDVPNLLTQPKNILIKIANNLDPESLQNLAFTCKDLLDFCLNTKGINVVYSIKEVSVDWDDGFIECVYDGEEFSSFLEKLKKWPFTIVIKRLYSDKFDVSYEEAQIKEFFVRHGVKKIRCFGNKEYDSGPVPKTVRDAKYFTEFVKALNIDTVSIRNKGNVSPDVVEICLQLPVKRLEMYWFNQNNFNFLPQCSIPTLIFGTDLSGNTKEAFADILKVWTTRNDLKKWCFSFDGDIISFFGDYEIRSCTYTGHVSRSNPPIFLETGSDFNGRTFLSFYILRQDGKVLRVFFGDSDELYYDHGCVVFSMCPVDKVPPALRDL